MKSSVFGLSLLALLGLASTAATAQAPLRSAVDATFAPHAMAKLGGGVQGFNVDLGEELAKRLGRKIEIEGAEFSGLVPGLNSKRYDFLVAPVTVTPERAKSLLFTEGYLDTDYTFLGTKAAPAIEKLEDLKGKTVAVNKGSNYEGWARDNAAKYGFKYDVYGANADAVQAVQSGRADYNLAGTTVVAWAAKQNPALKTSYTIKTGLVWALPFRADDKAGRDAASNALKCMKKDGTVAKLAVKWFGFQPGADDAAVKIAPGTGVPGTEGYDPTPVTPKCA
ncbi:transporter substrate-binding domain-containing protein [Comamonas endophytica]|uniref:Transporter substrate-binding domain-containing protein n=1 Tax=Comamonas endophytica TaxID=2949090 RepID=A0ABY6GFY4_9BURK|nr:MULTISPECIES: transporter substrate-binding domain-containing protein [unclassified Acidovorax]MCD2513406.1 transporter substrate-binding domain-containing protein [Acidovorax sp. D4N7]UYG53811.1 transporter substrate-binding domain-containing protein [Acidovorax sp. 5MLIR]